MLRSTKIRLFFTGLSVVVISILSWRVMNAYNLRCNYWPTHSQTYTFDLSMPTGYYAAINAGALAWTSSASSTWAWINSPTPGWLIKHVSIPGGFIGLTNLDPDSPCTSSVNFMDMKINSDYTYYTGTGTPPAGQYDLRGVATHEFGHGVALADIIMPNATYCPATNPASWPTMCGQYNGPDMRTLQPDDTAGLQYFYPPLVQWYWRGTEGRTRQVPIVSGVPDFNQGQTWSSPTTTLPGTSSDGPIQALANVATKNTLYTELWRNGTRWTRTAPISGGVVGTPTTWTSGLTNFGTQPGTGTVQANNYYLLCTTLYHQFWRGDEGWQRTIPLNTQTPPQPDWANASVWVKVADSSGLPGTAGTLQGFSMYQGGNQFAQAIWRGNLGWYRTVPIKTTDPCQLDFGNASLWNTTGIPISGLPGSGDMQATDNYELRQ